MEKKKKIKEEEGGNKKISPSPCQSSSSSSESDNKEEDSVAQKKVRILSKAKVSRWELPEDMTIRSAFSLISLTVTGRSLVYSSTDLGAYSANQSNQNLVKDISGVSLGLIVPFVFFLILTFVLQIITLKRFLLAP